MSISLTFNLTTDVGLADLNTFLESRSYMIGFSPTQVDVFAALLAKYASERLDKYPHVQRYVNHMLSFPTDVQTRFPDGLTQGVNVFEASPPEVPEAAATEKRKVRFAPGPAPGEKSNFNTKTKTKLKKDAPIERTHCVYEVKPAEAGQDMAELEALVRRIDLEGLTWGEEFKIVDVAYGIQKLIVQFVFDDRCGLQDVEDAVRSIGEEYVSSVDLCSMNRL